MEVLKAIYNLARETYGPFFPSPKAKREAFLRKTRDKVSYYKPKMEEICNVDMGEVQVKDFRKYLGDYTKDRLQEEYQEYTERGGHEPSGFVKGVIASPVVTGITIARPISWLFMSLSGPEMKHYNSSIYVPFHYMNRFDDLDFKDRERKLDQVVVHELSHRLWYALEGDKSSGRNWRVWNEGFAGYCADVHFADLYHQDFEVEQTNGFGIHARGKEKVEELVEKYGTQILLEVPKKWEQLAKNSS